MSNWTRRSFIHGGLTAGAALVLPSRSLLGYSANEMINVGFISCGGRAGGLMGSFSRISGVNIAGLCDPDQSRLDAASREYPRAKTWKDMRGLLDDKEIDAVVIATCNHWHCLAAIWAMEAGKDVYVEKPLSHSQWEGRQVVKAARKYGRICQVGTQQRSDPMQAEIKQFLHQDQALGKILTARVNRYGIREPIGKRSTPLPIPGHVDYELWLGPAQKKPIYREKLQYDWHWDWNTGSGEMGNWGVHVLDDLRNNVFLDKVHLPRRIFGGGGRISWNDAGETPNVHFVYFDTGTIPVVIGLANVASRPGTSEGVAHPGPGSGYIAYCEGGRLEGQRSKAAAFDSRGRVIREFSGNSGSGLHQQNFIDAVRQHDPSILNSGAQVGHYSTGWCNLANIAFQSGTAGTVPRSGLAGADLELWEGLVREMKGLLGAHGVKLKSPDIRMSSMLEIDSGSEKFVGEGAKTANHYLKRKYRKPFVIREV
jgi:hypothetical protein